MLMKDSERWLHHIKKRRKSALENSSILIAECISSFGNSFVALTLKKYNPNYLIILSRDKIKQWDIGKLFKAGTRVRLSR